MKKLIFFLSLLLALPIAAQKKTRSIAVYDAAASKTAAQNDILNWMSYLPDDVFVAHVSIPGTHDTTTGHGFSGTGIISASMHASQSQTQSATLDEQLAGGIRAFDFRPGMMGSGNNRYLNCNHGISPTKITMEEAFTKLTDFLDAHPGEFFIIHLFRGNVYSSGAPMYAYDSAEDKAKYNELMDEFFNKGKFSNYIVDYSPYLKVKDIRGKMVVFRRDRIDFAHIAKAGNLSGWPSDSENWTENSRTSVVNASDPTVKGQITATDVSNPETDALLEIELNSLTNINAYSRTQIRPNEAKKNGSYKPLWVMCFTSGENGSGRTGYLKNATYTNPHFTDLIKNSDVKGPTGIVFSDWVLTDKYDSYNTMGVELIPTIMLNNFDYIDQFILDDELFSENETMAENIWEDGKQYFMRNVSTGTYLSAGEWYGTHATLNKYGIKITPVFNKEDNTYTLTTTLNSNGGFGKNYYVDNTDIMQHIQFTPVHVEGNKFIFSYTNDNNEIKAVGIGDVEEKFKDDGTTHNILEVDVDKDDLSQQWELIDIEKLYKEQISNASQLNPVDISYKLSGGRFFGNDLENNTWIFSTSKSAKCDIASAGEDGHIRLIHMYSLKGVTGKDQTWSLTKEQNDLPNGIYKLNWKAYAMNIDDETMSVNGIDVKNQIKSGLPPTVKESGSVFNKKYETDWRLNEVGKDIVNDTYNCSVDLTITDGTLKIEASAPAHGSSTAILLDDFELIYYGPDPAEACSLLEKVVDEATAKVNLLPDNLKEGWEDDITQYRRIIETKNIIGDGTSEASEVYTLMRARTAQNLTAGADFTGMIANNSFELGTTFGWEIISSNDTKVWENSNPVYTVTNCDGDYLFNTWSKGTPITQKIPALPAGHYRLEALAVTGDTQDPRYVYLLAGNSISDAMQVNIDKTTFSDISFEFDMAEEGDAIIGIVGALEDGSYDEYGGWWYKADCFRLTYLGAPVMDSFYDFLRKAIDLATARVNMIPEQYRKGWNEEMALYEAIIENRTLEGDATKEANEIYNLMRKHVYSQDFADADYTPAIINNSFEWGNTFGWTVTTPGGDTGVKSNSNQTYAVNNCDGDYLFNAWNGDEFGSPITQVLPNLPAGIYKLEALVTSDQNNRVWITANSNRNLIQITSDKTEFHNIELTFTLNEPQDVTIGAIGGTNIGTYWATDGGRWYKADNFRLTYISKPEQSIEWTMEGKVYDTLILPFAADVPEDLEVYTASSTDPDLMSDEYHVLVLDRESSIEANKPYMVKRISTGEIITRNASPKNATVYTFTGVPENEEDSYTHGLLTGTLSGTTISAGHVMNHDDSSSYFGSVNSETQVPANHAYISTEQSTQVWHPIVYVEEPDNGGETGINGIIAEEATIDVYTSTGILVRNNVSVSNAFDGLDAGIYILSDGRRVLLSPTRR